VQKPILLKTNVVWDHEAPAELAKLGRIDQVSELVLSDKSRAVMVSDFVSNGNLISRITHNNLVFSKVI
jgi:hypothetical protein